MKRAVKASVDSDVQTILDLAKEGQNWKDMAFLRGSGKDVWYNIDHTKGVMPDGTPARLMVSEYIGNYDTGLYFERDFFTNVSGLLSKLRTPVVVERESDGNIFLEGHMPYGKRESYWDKKIAEYRNQNANSSTRSNMKRVVKGSRGTARDLINALNDRIDDIQDGTVASTEVTAMKSTYNRDSIRSQVEDYLGEYAKDFDVDGIVDEISDFETEDGSYVSDIDQIDTDEFQDVVRSHERNVAACSVKGSTEAFDDAIYDSLVARLGDNIAYMNIDKLFDTLYDIDPTMTDVFTLPKGQWENILTECRDPEFVVPSLPTTYQYSIEDTHETPQAGLEVLDFETWDELQEYLDENPDVQKRIEEGYATIKEL